MVTKNKRRRGVGRQHCRSFIGMPPGSTLARLFMWSPCPRMLTTNRFARSRASPATSIDSRTGSPRSASRRRDGVDQRLLDPGLRDPRSARLRGPSRQRARREECPRPQDRRERCTVDPAAPCSTGLLRGASVRTTDRRAASLSSPPRASRRVRGGAHPAHAEGPHADERPASPCGRRHHRRHRHEDHSRDRGW